MKAGQTIHNAIFVAVPSVLLMVSCWISGGDDSLSLPDGHDVVSCSVGERRSASGGRRLNMLSAAALLDAPRARFLGPSTDIEIRDTFSRGSAIPAYRGPVVVPRSDDRDDDELDLFEQLEADLNEDDLVDFGLGEEEEPGGLGWLADGVRTLERHQKADVDRRWQQSSMGWEASQRMYRDYGGYDDFDNGAGGRGESFLLEP